MPDVLTMTGVAQTDPVAMPDPRQHRTWASGLLSNYQIIRCNGAVVPFEPHKIAVEDSADRHAGYAGPRARLLHRGRSRIDAGLVSTAHEDCPRWYAHSNCTALAPTATIFNIIGVDASIDRIPAGLAMLLHNTSRFNPAAK